MAKQLKRWQMAVVRRINGCRFHLRLTRVVALRTKGRSGEHLQ